jgi:hypothetical protein
MNSSFDGKPDGSESTVVARGLAANTENSKLNVNLWRNSQDRSWSVEINGTRHECITFEKVKQLVAQALNDSKKLSLKPPPTQ